MKSALGILVVAGALLLAPGAEAEDPGNAPPDGKAAVPAAAGSSGKAAPSMVVTIDRETGRLRPATAAERAALAAAGARKALALTGEPTVVETLPDGRKRARLGPEYARYSVARVSPDGSVSSDCVSAGKVDAALKAPDSAAPAAPEK